jgi:hypothetical protein
LKIEDGNYSIAKFLNFSIQEIGDGKRQREESIEGFGAGAESSGAGAAQRQGAAAAAGQVRKGSGAGSAEGT